MKCSPLSGTGSVAYLCTGTDISQSPQYMGGFHGYHPLILYLAIPSPTGRNLYPYIRLGPHWSGKYYSLNYSNEDNRVSAKG
jgi:hypothetical protein